MTIGIVNWLNIPIQANDSFPVEYSVSAIIPPSQVNNQVSYFDVAVKAQQKQVLSTMIGNSSEHEIYVRQQINNAYTNDLGELSYTYAMQHAPKVDQSMQYPLTKVLVLSSPRIVKVPAHSTRQVSATLKPAISNNFNGTILGGWSFQQVDAKGKIINNGGASISMAYSYVLGVKLNVGHNVKPKLTFGTLGYHQNTNSYPINDDLTIKLTNTAPAILHRIRLVAKVTDNKGKVQFEQKYGPLSIAPNSGLTYDLITKKKLAAGRYKIDLMVANKQQQWVETRYFKLTNNKNNKLVLKPISKPTNWWLIGGISLAVLGIFSGGIWYYLRKVKA